MTEFNLNGFIKFPTKSQKKFKSIKWKVKGEEYISEGETPDEPDGPNVPDNIDCLCFTSTGNSTIALTNSYNTPVLYYSKDKKKWNIWDYTTITLADGESIYFCGENPNGFSTDRSRYSRFRMTGSIAASGNIQTLLSLAGDRMDVTPYCYFYMFSSCAALTEAPELPATTLANYCYESMFDSCTALTAAPELPATTVSIYSYGNMFRNCKSLTTAPTTLLATNLAEYCYYQMFYGCEALTTVPELSATTLAKRCCQDMFRGCSSLTTAPKLPATTLAQNCYYGMFYDCIALTEAPELPATTLAEQCYSYMFRGCDSLQSATTYCVNWNTSYTEAWLSGAGKNATNPTVYCPADSTIPSDNQSGIPTGWTRADLPTS